MGLNSWGNCSNTCDLITSCQNCNLDDFIFLPCSLFSYPDGTSCSHEAPPPPFKTHSTFSLMWAHSDHGLPSWNYLRLVCLIKVHLMKEEIKKKKIKEEKKSRILSLTGNGCGSKEARPPSGPPVNKPPSPCRYLHQSAADRVTASRAEWRRCNKKGGDVCCSHIFVMRRRVWRYESVASQLSRKGDEYLHGSKRVFVASSLKWNKKHSEIKTQLLSLRRIVSSCSNKSMISSLV